jgi:cbb3-type cytochrome oxidase maturation protein
MSVIYIVLPIALLIVGGMLWGFFRSVKQGQFDDLETPAVRMLFDDDPLPASELTEVKSKKKSSDSLSASD